MKKVALVGASMRIRYFVEALKEDYSQTHQVCAVMDIDKGKMRSFSETVGINLIPYTNFEEMCDKIEPDLLLISTTDYFHSEYIVKALDRKISLICEKPLCVNKEQCKAIIEAQIRNPDVFAVTSHNARYHIAARTVKKLLDEDVIGKINSVTYSEMLDFSHGASYFRRWNRIKKLSGGLQIHKSSHHFDKLNWWIDSKVSSVVASGSLRNFGEKVSPFHGERCFNCKHKEECKWEANYEQEASIDYNLFMKYSTDSSYIPDMCVFSPEIDIEDFLSVGMEYNNGVTVNYTLAAHCNYEGETIIFEGEKGRIEMIRRKRPVQEYSSIEIFRYGEIEPEKMDLKLEQGSHGGADNRLYEDLFSEKNTGILATLDDGLQAVLGGIAVNESLESGSQIDVQSIL